MIFVREFCQYLLHFSMAENHREATPLAGSFEIKLLEFNP